MARYVEGIADPERPVAMDAFAAMELNGQAPRLTLGRIGKLAAALLAVLALTMAWHLTPLSAVVRSVRNAGHHDGPCGQRLGAAFGAGERTWAGGLVAFPLIVLIAATAATFGPVLGFAYGLVGSLASAVSRTRSEPGSGAAPCRACSDRGSIAFAKASIAAASSPSPPYDLFRSRHSPSSTWWQAPATSASLDYVVGTTLGLLPGLLLMSALGYQIFRFMVEPSFTDFLLLAGGAVIWVAVVVVAQRFAAKVASRPS